MSTDEKRGDGDLKLYKISESLEAVSSFLATEPYNPIRFGLYDFKTSIVLFISFCDNINQR